MKASELIALLAHVVGERGDLDITVEDGRNNTEAAAHTVEFRPKEGMYQPDRIFISGDWV